MKKNLVFINHLYIIPVMKKILLQKKKGNSIFYLFYYNTLSNYVVPI